MADPPCDVVMRMPPPPDFKVYACRNCDGGLQTCTSRLDYQHTPQCVVWGFEPFDQALKLRRIKPNSLVGRVLGNEPGQYLETVAVTGRIRSSTSLQGPR